jgi:2-iminoacetate synthase ThiH
VLLKTLKVLSLKVQSINYLVPSRSMSEFQINQHWDDLHKLSQDRAIPDQEGLQAIAMQGSDRELSLGQTNQLMNAIWLPPEEFAPIKDSIINIANALRKVIFNGYLVGMTPLEVGNYCASNCDFCGWRSDNKGMQRKSVSQETILAEAEYYIQRGIREIELVCGDHMPTIQNIFPDLVKEIRQKLDASGGGKIHICTAALTQKHYEEFQKIGADAVITWQETYNSEVYNQHITQGPKARGITPTGRLKRNGDGYNFRLTSQDRAAKAGLDVAIGSMLGLNENTNFEVLSTIVHARHLIETYGFDEKRPLIIGMPTWNSIPTPDTDNRPKMNIDIEEIFPYIAAVYFLSLPRENAWVFPNCRVSLATQIESIRAGGIFTSTSVKVGAGGNLPEVLRYMAQSGNKEGTQTIINLIANELNNKQLSQVDIESFGQDPNKFNALLTSLSQQFDKFEQFNHHYHDHSIYEEAFKKAGYALTQREDVKLDRESLQTLDNISRFKAMESIKPSGNGSGSISVKSRAYGS